VCVFFLALSPSIRFMQLHNTPLDRLLQRHVEVAAEIKNLDSDMQMLVYENYNKFISATDTIRRYELSSFHSHMHCTALT
jgi:hypothetical protein